ncbi:MAG: amidohydrolase family protein [Marinibacterium sp.]
MTDIRITNCHIHTFTGHHVPPGYPFWWTRPFKTWPRLVKGLATAARLIGQHPLSEKLMRLHAFNKESQTGQQGDILANVKKHYPGNTRFVILPMEMSAFGYGAPKVPLRRQHDELAELAASPDHGASVIPFATIDPRADPEGVEVWRMIEDHGFRGIKLYPRLGFAPDDEVLRTSVFARANDFERDGRKGLPVMSHCSRGGVQGRDLSNGRADRFTEPMAYDRILREFPNLRICLAHFGGQRDWKAYADPDTSDLPDGALNWQVEIRRMIGSGEYPGLWTDISYTLFEFEEYLPFLRLLLLGDEDRHERLRQRVLFGSDFYMTRQEKLSEKAVCFRLRNALGEEMFRRMAEENPEVWLGERDPRPYP